MNWEKIDWSYLLKLRGLYTGDQLTNVGAYFETDAQLASYHLTLAERIGWKWDYVLNELKHRGIEIQSEQITDWGCGSGMASLKLLGMAGSIGKVQLWDRSSRAMSFANQQIATQYQSCSVERLTEAPKQSQCLLLSHVLNELSHAHKAELFKLVENSELVIWVENGTHATSRDLSLIRNRLLESGQFEVLAPCTHQAPCGVFKPENERHWCHTFAKIPSEIHQSPEWRDLSHRLSIDLRSLALSFLVLVKKGSSAVKRVSAHEDETLHRLLGEARHYKGFSKLLTCHGQRGVSEIILQKREAPDLMKALQKSKFEAPLLKVELEGEKIQSGAWV